jgi:hypothetical protein
MSSKWRVTPGGMVFIAVTVGLLAAGAITGSGVLLGAGVLLLLILALAASGTMKGRMMGGSGYDPDRRPDGYDGD